MNKIFIIIRDFLQVLANISGFSYMAINIIVYYFITPFIFIVLIDQIFNVHYLKISYILTIFISITLINDFEKFSEWLFNKSANFLNSFKFIGWNYTVASVIICFIIPLFVLSFLVYFAFRWNIRHNAPSPDQRGFLFIKEIATLVRNSV